MLPEVSCENVASRNQKFLRVKESTPQPYMSSRHPTVLWMRSSPRPTLRMVGELSGQLRNNWMTTAATSVSYSLMSSKKSRKMYARNERVYRTAETRERERQKVNNQHADCAPMNRAPPVMRTFTRAATKSVYF